MLRRIALLSLAMTLCGCRTPYEYPGPLTRAFDTIIHPFRTHCYAVMLKPGTRYMRGETWVELGEDGEVYPLEPNSEEGIPRSQPIP